MAGHTTYSTNGKRRQLGAQNQRDSSQSSRKDNGGPLKWMGFYFRLTVVLGPKNANRALAKTVDCPVVRPTAIGSLS